MVRIGISVEGSTEERFVKKVLDPYLVTKGIYMTPISMGGDVNVERAKSELKKIANNFDFVTTLYDFYGFKKRLKGEDKVALEQRLLSEVHPGVRAKLIPYIQMYEFEGLLFSCPESMARGLNDSSAQQWCQEVLNDFGGNPEAINNSVETAPSKRLLEHTKYRKTTHGPNIAEEIGIPKIRDKCTGFHEWLCQIELLAK